MNSRVNNSVAEYDLGLRSYLSAIYNWMVIGLMVSAGAATFAHASGLTDVLKTGGILFWIVALLPFAIILFMGAATAGAMPVTVMVMAYLAFTFLEGLSLSVVLSRYTGTSIAVAFTSTAVAFAALSLYGYTTKRNLTGMGSFFLVALIGLIVAMIINVFFPAPILSFIVNAAGVLIFAGLVAYDTQTMRMNYRPGDAEANARFAVWHALDLYLDFINLMMFLLRFVGVKAGDD